ncbi:hypothetical protein TNCV_885001 [Trichonephila clavipes]|nr:hypothetical protein TNCV_885001 [Trichonephila clavipes]
MIGLVVNVVSAQWRSYRRINDTGPRSYMGLNMCNYSPTNRALMIEKAPSPRRKFDTRLPQNQLRQCISYKIRGVATTVSMIRSPQATGAPTCVTKV